MARLIGTARFHFVGWLEGISLNLFDPSAEETDVSDETWLKKTLLRMAGWPKAVCLFFAFILEN